MRLPGVMTPSTVGVMTNSRRYRGCEIIPGPVRVYMSYGPNGVLVSGWHATCECGLRLEADTQTLLRQRITAHKWYGRPVRCEGGKS